MRVDDLLHFRPDCRDLLEAQRVNLFGARIDRGEVTDRRRITFFAIGVGTDGDRFVGLRQVGLLEKPGVPLHRGNHLLLEHLAHPGCVLRIADAHTGAQQRAVFGQQCPALRDHGWHVEARRAVSQCQAFAQIQDLGIDVSGQARQSLENLPSVFGCLHRLNLEQRRNARVPPCRAARRPQLRAAHPVGSGAGERLAQDAVAHPVATADFSGCSDVTQLGQPPILPHLPRSQCLERIVGQAVVTGAWKRIVGTDLGVALQERLQVLVGDLFDGALGFDGSAAAEDRCASGCENQPQPGTLLRRCHFLSSNLGRMGDR